MEMKNSKDPMKIKSHFSEKLKKKDKSLARLIKEEREGPNKIRKFKKNLKILSYSQHKHTNYHKSNTIIWQKTDKPRRN